MPKFKDYNQNQLILLPPSLQDWIPKDHICFMINEVVDSLDLTSIKNTYSSDGSPAYNPKMLIKVMFYAYTQGTRSSRKIEKMTQENIACRYLTAGNLPDHGTINLFRKNRLIQLESIFTQIVMLCEGLNIIDVTDISIDGTIIKASAARNKTYTRKSIKNIKKKIKQILTEAEDIDKEEDKKFGNKRGYDQIPEKLLDPKTRKKEIERLQKKIKNLTKTDKTIKNKQKDVLNQEKKLSRNNTHNMTDGDANLMKMKSGRSYKPAYNGQIATNHQIVLAYDVTGDGVDTNLLIPMVEKSEDNVGKKIKSVKADASYFSKNNIEVMEYREVEAYIPDKDKYAEEKGNVSKYHKKNFTYIKKKDVFVCPQKQRLYLHQTVKGTVKKYICKSCCNCPVKSLCTKGKNRQVHFDSVLEKYKTTMRKKLNSVKGKHKYLERLGDVEPVFGNIIYNQNAGHFLCRGRTMVKREFGLSCIAHNIVKLAGWVRKNGKSINDLRLNELTRLPSPIH